MAQFGCCEDKNRCGISDERCGTCNNRVEEDLAHFLVDCVEFERSADTLDDVCGIGGRIVL